MGVRVEVLPFLVVAVAVGILVALACRALRKSWRGPAIAGGVIALILAAYFLYFFRDPLRVSPADESAIVAGAEGKIAKVTELTPAEFLKAAQFSGLTEATLGRFQGKTVTRISIFLSLFDVHVNRAPIAGSARFLGYFPGEHVFTFKEKSSDVNQHNSIIIEGNRTVCLVNQIVGPVARRVVYWPDKTRAVPLAKGDKIGMMKFGSRLDMYFPKDDIVVSVKEGDFVRAGETVVAVIAPDRKQ